MALAVILSLARALSQDLPPDEGALSRILEGQREDLTFRSIAQRLRYEDQFGSNVSQRVHSFSIMSENYHREAGTNCVCHNLKAPCLIEDLRTSLGAVFVDLEISEIDAEFPRFSFFSITVPSHKLEILVSPDGEIVKIIRGRR